MKEMWLLRHNILHETYVSINFIDMCHYLTVTPNFPFSGIAFAFLQPCISGSHASTAECAGGVCYCLVGYYNSSGDCEPAMLSECITDEECLDRSLSNSFCTQGRCHCLPGFFYPNQTLRTNCFEGMQH